MEAIRVSFKLKSPLIIDTPICLDSLLAFALYQESGDLNVAHEQLPLARTNGVWHASQMRMEGPVMYQSVDFSMSLKQADMDTRLFSKNGRKGYVFIDQVRGDHKANLDAYQGLVSKTGMVHFYAFGDKEKIESLLRAHIFAIGKKHQQGYGSIESMTVESIERDYSMLHPSMGVMRQLPVESDFGSAMDGIEGLSTEFTAFAPPYYQTPQQLCYVPHSVLHTASDIVVQVDDYF